MISQSKARWVTLKDMGTLDLDRQGLSALLGPYLAGGRAANDADKRLVSGSGAVKTYAVESDGSDDPGELLSRVFHPTGAGVDETADPDLWVVRGDKLTLFVDTLDARFWLVHTASSSVQATRTIHRWLWDTSRFDSCWFTQEFLQSVRREGQPRWFKADFRGDGYLPAGDVSDRRLRVQLEGDGADDLFDMLRQDPRYRTASALAAVGFVVGESPDVAVDEVTRYDGSFVTHGRSFDTHVGYVAGIVDRYRAEVERIESRHRLRWTAGDSGVRFDGDVATVQLARPVQDLDQLLASMFSCRDPFRLWAVPRKHGDDFAAAEVVDLHIGEAFSMDIGLDYVRVYLPESACGNTVMRLVTNLQRHYDATASLVGSSELLTSVR